MPYPRRCHVLPTIPQDSDYRIRKRVKENIVEEVPETTHVDAEGLCPFKYDLSIPTIVAELLSFTDGSDRTDAVYVLECRRSMKVSDARDLGISGKSALRQASSLEEKPRRILYVGSTSNLLRRLNEHLNSPADDGAYITGMCPPLRVLAVGWFKSRSHAYQGESLAAQLLRERFPEDLVCYPG
jgi:predicted GIY-YIG superfamily endonuclease